MAGSRLPKIGDIFTRTTNLLRAGGMKPQDKPVWYDVYEAFPPLQAPTYERSKPSSLDVKQIFYPEDLIRAKFYRKYGSPGTIRLNESLKHKRQTICETFVAAYQEIESRQEGLSPDQLMQEAEVELERRGIYPDRTKRPRTVESLDEPLEEVLETKSAITAAALPDYVMKKINFNELFAHSSTSRGSESAEASGTGTGASGTGTGASGTVTGASATNSATAENGAVSSKNLPDTATSTGFASVKDQKKDGSSGSGST